MMTAMGGDEGEYLGEADDGDHLEGGDDVEGYDDNPELENDGNDAEDVMEKFYDGVKVDDASDEHSSVDYWNEEEDGDDPGEKEVPNVRLAFWPAVLQNNV